MTFLSKVLRWSTRIHGNEKVIFYMCFLVCKLRPNAACGPFSQAVYGCGKAENYIQGVAPADQSPCALRREPPSVSIMPQALLVIPLMNTEWLLWAGLYQRTSALYTQKQTDIGEEAVIRQTHPAAGAKLVLLWRDSTRRQIEVFPQHPHPFLGRGLCFSGMMTTWKTWPLPLIVYIFFIFSKSLVWKK